MNNLPRNLLVQYNDAPKQVKVLETKNLLAIPPQQREPYDPKKHDIAASQTYKQWCVDPNKVHRKKWINRTALCMPKELYRQIKSARLRHRLTSVIIVKAVMDHFDSLHNNYQAAILRGQKIPFASDAYKPATPDDIQAYSREILYALKIRMPSRKQVDRLAYILSNIKDILHEETPPDSDTDTETDE